MSDISPDSEDADYGLVMPFVVVASRGGRYADDAYAAGWEMGRFWALVAQLEMHVGNARVDILLPLPIRADNVAQADLIAMHHGWQLRDADAGDGWRAISLKRRETD